MDKSSTSFSLVYVNMILWDDGRAHMEGHDEYVYEGPFKFRVVPGVDTHIQKHFEIYVLPIVDMWYSTPETSLVSCHV